MNKPIPISLTRLLTQNPGPHVIDKLKKGGENSVKVTL